MGTSSTVLAVHPREIARAVRLPAVMRHFGWKVHRGEKRADCGLCKGNSRGTVAITERLWKCHRCQAGGDAFSLVMQVQRCDFAKALHYIADHTGIPLPAHFSRADFKREVEHKRQEHSRIERSAEFLADMERQLRLQCRDWMHLCDSVLSAPPPWSDGQWRRAKAAQILRDECLLPEYCILAFGSLEERARFVLGNDSEKADICRAIREAGRIRTDNGFFMEVTG